MADLAALWEKNAAAFRQNHTLISASDSGALFAALSDDDKTLLAEGVKDARWKYRDRLIHSGRNAEREAARAAETLAGASAVIAVSLGAGYMLAQLPSSVREVLVIEPSVYVAAAFILSGEFYRYNGKITLFVDPLGRSDALEEILPWLQGKNLKRTLIYVHPPLLAADKSLYTRAYQRVESLFEKRSINQATVVKFQQLWNKNIFLNQRSIWGAGRLNDLFACTPPETIVLAGAGPSLARSFTDLKSYRDRYILFAADTAVIPLAKAGIVPDFAFAADPQWLNHYFAQTSVAARSIWIMDPVVCPAIPHFLSRLGAHQLFWNSAFRADAMFRDTDRGDVAHGGSVSTNAFDIAVRWLTRRGDEERAGRLILVGQDLSFSNKQAHCAGAVLEARVFAQANRLAGMENHNLRQMRAMPVLWEKGIAGKDVPTNGKLKIFLEWFAARAADLKATRIELVNATAAGAVIRGFEHRDLVEALNDRSQEKPVRLSFSVAQPGNKEERLRRLVSDLASLARLARENAGLTKQTGHGVIDRLNANDLKLRELGLASEIAGLNAQAIILKITEQGADTDAGEFYTALARAGREVRHWARKNLSEATAI